MTFEIFSEIQKHDTSSFERFDKCLLPWSLMERIGFFFHILRLSWFPFALRIFECNRPLQLGGVADPIPTSTSFVGANFNGCIKNLIDNGKLYDLEVNDAGSQNPPVGGCASADSGCFTENGRPYCVNGVCDTSSSEVSCVCHAGWSGTRCNSGELRLFYTIFIHSGSRC